LDWANFIPRGVLATTGTIRMPGSRDQMVIHSLGKGTNPFCHITGPITNPINPPITEAGRKSFWKIGTKARSRVPASKSALRTQKQYSNCVSIALVI
jgi:hypothetical protein